MSNEQNWTATNNRAALNQHNALVAMLTTVLHAPPAPLSLRDLRDGARLAWADYSDDDERQALLCDRYRSHHKAAFMEGWERATIAMTPTPTARIAGIRAAQDELVKRDCFTERTLDVLDDVVQALLDGEAGR